ncbi:MAG: hypothetical protein KAI66_19535 [Lentisphaeria bacterium]|nr:hypothetical protein [Lentisphaeria bacterium]
MQTLTFREDAPSYVTDIAVVSAVSAALALSSLSNAAILADEFQAQLFSSVPHHMEQFDTAGYTSIPVPAEMEAVSPHEAAQAFSAFVTKLAENMQPAPAEVHREVAERPWDFV